MSDFVDFYGPPPGTVLSKEVYHESTSMMSGGMIGLIVCVEEKSNFDVANSRIRSP